MVKLDYAQLNKKLRFIDEYLTSSNAAEGSKFDANANVDSKNIATMEAEIHKDINIQINRELVRRELETLYGQDFSFEYIDQLEKHIIYTHDETSLKPYCVSVTMYPFLLDGVTKLGGESKAPNHLASFNGTFINFVFATAAQFAGAVATVEWLMYFDYFARKDYGDDYLVTHKGIIDESLQHVVYSINQPAAARGYQSVFWNISIYDKPYFEAMFGDFTFPNSRT
jgi:ribonucleoside-triphosphate reductase